MAEVKRCSRCGQPRDDLALHCLSCGRIFWWSTLGLILGCYLVGTVALLILINTSSVGWRIAGIVAGWLALLTVFGVLADTLARSEMIRSRAQGNSAGNGPSLRTGLLRLGVGLLGLGLTFGSIEGSRWYADQEKERAKLEAERQEAHRKSLQALGDALQVGMGGPAILAAPIVPGLMGRPDLKREVKACLLELRKLHEETIASKEFDQRDRTKAIQLVERYVSGMERILKVHPDLPQDYSVAYADHVLAWKQVLEFTKEHADQLFGAVRNEQTDADATALLEKAVTRGRIMDSVSASYGFDPEGNEQGEK